MPTEVAALLSELGLSRYATVLAQSGYESLEDLRCGRDQLSNLLPLGPKARLIREIDLRGDPSVRLDAIQAQLMPYAHALSGVLGQLSQSSRRPTGSLAARQLAHVSSIHQLCSSALQDIQRIRELSKRSGAAAAAELASKEASLSATVSQLHIHQQKGTFQAIEEAVPLHVLPTLDLSSFSIGVRPTKDLRRPAKKHTPAAAPSLPDHIDGAVLRRLRTLRDPPTIVKQAVSAMLLLLGYHDTTWGAAKEVLGGSGVLERLEAFDDSTVSQRTLSLVEEFATDPDWTAEEVGAACPEAGAVTEWVRETYARVKAASDGRPPPPADRSKPSPPHTTSPAAQSDCSPHIDASPRAGKFMSYTAPMPSRGAPFHPRSRRSRSPRATKASHHPESTPEPPHAPHAEEPVEAHETKMPSPLHDSAVLKELTAIREQLAAFQAPSPPPSAAAPPTTPPATLLELASLWRMVSVSRSLMKYLAPQQTRSTSSDCDLPPLGSYVHVERWSRGDVISHARGRVGVLLQGGKEVGVVPAVLRHVARSTDELQEAFPVGAYVKERGQLAKVIGHSRGRVGVEYFDGRQGGVLPSHLRVVPCEEWAREMYPVGALVEVGADGEHGLVISHSRGRVGVRLDDGRVIGVPQGSQDIQLAEYTTRELRELFPIGVRAVAEGHLCTIAGHHRGRVGVVFADGQHRGVLPHLIQIDDNAVAGKLFPIGTRVSLLRSARVVGRDGASGVAVRFDNGVVTTVPVVRVVKLDTPLEELFPVGTAVDLPSSKQSGKVVATRRGRVEVEVADGKVLAFLPPHVERLGCDAVLRDFPIGQWVDVPTTQGEVISISRGRLLIAHPDGTRTGAIRQQLQATPLEHPEELFPVGCKVGVGPTKGATVVGATSSGELRVEIGDRVVEVPAHLVVPDEGDNPSEEYPVGAAVMVKDTFSGHVVGHSRGRIGVQLPDGSKTGCLPHEVVVGTAPLSEAFPIGAEVTVSLRGRVVAHSRGRAGVELLDGTHVGALPDQLTRVTAHEVPQSRIPSYRGASSSAPPGFTEEALLGLIRVEHELLLGELTQAVESVRRHSTP